jgi:methyl-accepting chemotaxis protein
MADKIPWNRSVGGRLAAISLAVILLGAAASGSSFFTIQAVSGELAEAAVLTQSRALTHQLMIEATRLPDASQEERARIMAGLRQSLSAMEERFVTVRDGNPALGVRRPTDPSILAATHEREALWKRTAVPTVERLIAARTREEIVAALNTLRADIAAAVDRINLAIATDQSRQARLLDSMRSLQFAIAGLLLLAGMLVLWIGRGLSRRLRTLALASERMVGGDLELATDIEGGDEVATLGTGLNSLATSLRKRIKEERQNRESLKRTLEEVTAIAAKLASASAEIVAASSQQATGAQEQTTAISQTVTTVDQVAVTSQEAAQRAASLAEQAGRTEETSRLGKRSVEETVTALGLLRDQMEKVAAGILTLAEKSQAIAEITSSIKDFAEQSHILALNAAIEASRAGEAGRGFSVVASEVKALADQSKTATARVRSILSEIQKATNASVMAAEEGQKSAGAAMKVVGQAGESLRAIGEHVSEGARVAAQTVASAGQQATGVAQIRQAMKHINEATRQNMAASRQTEQAARDLNNLGIQLQDIIRAHGR